MDETSKFPPSPSLGLTSKVQLGKSIMNERRTRISLREFIAFDYLSTDSIRFNAVQPCLSVGMDLSYWLNATTLALLLAKAFVKLEWESNKEGSDDIDLAALHLDNFFVIFEHEVVSKKKLTAQNDQYSFGKNGAHDDVVDHHEKQDQDLNDDFPNSQFTLGTSALDCRGETASRNSSGTLETTWTILDVNFQPGSSNGLGQSSGHACIHKKIPLIQTLGKHIHAIFSQTYGEAPFLIDQLIAMTERGGGSDQQISKQRIFKQNSLFSNLLETGCYPVSICRLLSDMIDSGDDGKKADNPFTSVDEVIQDLDQMLNAPQIFLQDQGHEFWSHNLQFGQRCYGRVKELTKFLEISTKLERSTCPSSCNDLEAVFVSGIAGSGKSHFLQNVGRFLTNLGWMVLKVKFKREMEHSSREIVSSLFEKLVANIVEMRSSDDEADIDYHRRATEAISDELDPSQLSCLAIFIPSIRDLFPDIDTGASAGSDASLWLLGFLLSKLVNAIRNLGRHILMCFDDLQWCDSSMLTFITKLIMSVGQNEKGRQYLVFVGMYRDDEISESHSFTDLLTGFQENNDIHVTEIKLSCLLVEEVAGMIMSEMRIPRRLVSGLSQVVHKKTSGHAIFVVQVLNSLVRDSTIAYSPSKHRFDWNENKISTLRMGDSVASLIVSNLSSLQVENLQSLRILSCFGIQVPLSVVKLVAESPCVPEGGIESFLPSLIDSRIVEMSGNSIFFPHDLIQQHIYENIPIKERQRLHLDIGNSIAAGIALDSSPTTRSIEEAVDRITLENSNAEHGSTSPPSYLLVAIATNQVNFAGPDFVADRQEKIKFARWNLRAGKYSADLSHYQAAAYYYKSGIAFLGDGLWIEDCHQLCRELHDGLASTFFSLGDHVLAIQQANVVIDNVPFEDSLISQYLLIRSLDNFGHYEEATAHGLDLLRLLKMHIPSEPSPSILKKVMEETGRAASAYSFEQITNTQIMVDAKKRETMRCANALSISLFRLASPYLPLVGCAGVNYSLQNGICLESAGTFLIFGFVKISEGKYKEGCYWGNVIMKLVDSVTSKISLHTNVMCTQYLSIYYYPFRDLALRQMDIYRRCMTLGEYEAGTYALKFSLVLSYYSGEKLSLLLNSAEKLLELLMNHSKEAAKVALLNKMLFGELSGKSNNIFPDFGGGIQNERTLLVDAQARKNPYILEAIYVKRFNSAFWMGDYAEASKCSRQILALPTSKMPKIQLVIHNFFMGLIAFQVYRKGGGEEHLEEGKKALEQMETWSESSAANFSSKLLLLKAEHYAAACEIHAAKLAYEASGRSARHHGLIHEQGLAFELGGKFLSSLIETDEALHWFRYAHECYVQWGALAKANQLWKEHNLGKMQPAEKFGQAANKHGREW